GIEAGEHRGQDDQRHRLAGPGKVHHRQRVGEGRLAGHDAIPRHDRDDQEDGGDVEEQNAGDHGGGHARQGALRIARFHGCDRGDLRAREREEHRGHPSQHRERAVRQEAPLADEVACPRLRRRTEQSQHKGTREHDEQHDGRHLDRGEPELELAVGARRHEIHAGHGQHQQRTEQWRGQCDPLMQQPGACDRLDRHDDDPEVPVQPADHEAGATPEPRARKLGEAARTRQDAGHLRQHAHDQQDQQPRDEVAEHHGRPHGCDRRGAADEQARADDAADADHRHMARRERAAERARSRARGGRISGGERLRSLAAHGLSNPAVTLTMSAPKPPRQPNSESTVRAIVIRPSQRLMRFAALPLLVLAIIVQAQPLRAADNGDADSDSASASGSAAQGNAAHHDKQNEHGHDEDQDRAAKQGFMPGQQRSTGSVVVGGQRINYVAYAGTLVVHPKGWDDVPQDAPKDQDKGDQPEASMFYVAYFRVPEGAGTAARGSKQGRDDNGDRRRGNAAATSAQLIADSSPSRPITFIYNGGPGSSTVWLHMGAFGPRRVVTLDDAHTPAAPYQLVNNDHSLLDASDLVFIDAPGTGFSRIGGKNRQKSFYGV